MHQLATVQTYGFLRFINLKKNNSLMLWLLIQLPTNPVNICQPQLLRSSKTTPLQTQTSTHPSPSPSPSPNPNPNQSMASSATLLPSSFCPSLNMSNIFHQRFHPKYVACFTKISTIRAASTSIEVSKPSTQSKAGKWEWKYKDNAIKIYYEEHAKDSVEPAKNILMVPTISDVSTVDEWRMVAKDIVQRESGINWRATIVDWPGLGFSDRPKMEYDADVMEIFLADFINAPDSPVNSSENDLVVFGGGHAASITVQAAKKGLVKPAAIAAVAPTWAGPLPIVFGRDSSMESRYEFLRGTLRAPALGWMMYNVLVSNEKAIKSQYESHVYADSSNVTPAIIESRYALTKQKGARYVPAAFLTGLLDPVKTREEFLDLFAELEGKMPVLVVSSKGSPRRSKAEMEALRGAKGVSKFVEVLGALLPHEEYPADVAKELYLFLQETFNSKP